MTKEQLIAFEEDIAAEFNAKKIRAPVHLYYGNEDAIIEVFKKIRIQDYVLCTWRSHYQCLLKGVPTELVKQRIMEGKSISLCFPEYRVFSSAIVTGALPIAVGLGLSIKRSKTDEKVFCFLGDMASETGSFWECFKYAFSHQLPVHFIIEDNNKSVCTDTRKTWNLPELFIEKFIQEPDKWIKDYITYYKYENKYPHAGAGVRVQF